MWSLITLTAARFSLWQESKILQDQMKLVKDDIQRVEQDTAHSMEQLLALDCVKGSN